MKLPARQPASKPLQPPMVRLEKAIARRQEGGFMRALAELDASSRSENWGYRVLRLLLDMPSAEPGDRDRQVKWMRRLFRCTNPPQPSPTEKFMEYATSQRISHVLPLLHAAGFRLEDGRLQRMMLARFLAQGHWPHPELLLPGLMRCPDARDQFCRSLDTALMDHEGGGFLVSTHVEKFCALHIPQPTSLRADIHMRFNAFTQHHGTGVFHPTPCTTRALVLLHHAGLINLGKLVRAYERNACLVSLLAPAVAALEAEDLEARMGKIAQSRTPARL